MASWDAKYKKGQFVEVLHHNKWTEGFVVSMKEMGYRSFNIQLLTDGRIVTETFRSIRPSTLDMGDDKAFQTKPPAKQSKEQAQKGFKDLEEDEFNELELGAKASNTHRQTAWGLKIFKDWLQEVGEDLEFEHREKTEVAALLKRFYAGVRMKDGNEYSKKSLLCICACLQHYLSEPPYNVAYNVIIDPAFSASNNILKGHIKKNKQAGLDQSTHYPPITNADEKLTYSSRVLSHDTPKSLQMKVYYEFSLHFGRRAREGLHSLMKHHFIFKEDDEGHEYSTLSFNLMEKITRDCHKAIKSIHKECMVQAWRIVPFDLLSCICNDYRLRMKASFRPLSIEDSS